MLGCVINLDEERLLRSYDRVGNAIVDYIYEMDLSWEIEMASKIYFGKHIDIMGQNRWGLNHKPFIQWLIFSYKLHSGCSLIDCIYNQYIKGASIYERDALKSLKNTYESFYKVYGVENDKILVKNIFTGEKIYIWDNLLVKNIKRYSGIFTRIVSINNKYIPIPGYSIMTNSFLKDTEQYIKERYKEHIKFDKSTSIQSFIGNNSLMIHRYFLNYSV